MAWADTSAMAGSGWGDEDTTFATDKPMIEPRQQGTGDKADRFPVPLSIGYILAHEIVNDKIAIGDEQFDTGKVLGIVVSSEKSETDVKYVLRDPDDDEKTIDVTYFPNTDREKMQGSFAEGTQLLILGKIRTFGDNKMIASFFMKEVTNADEWENRLLETRYIHKLFESGILHRVQAEGGHALEGWQETFLGGPPELDNSHTGNASGGGNSTFIQNGPSSRIYGQSSTAQAASQSNAAAGKSLGGIRGQILNYVKSVKQQHEDDGVSVDEIIKGMKLSNRDAVMNDLSFLVAEGHLYNTSSEDKFLPIDA
ncbi:hypothetical protein WR25_09377 [Diploscapter pachys]|uniref:Replication protein A C-terminal domain-containing protein n=1 Tax=Diploscapter pachys TaxID=2018661 RepID=A0A2A2KK78_9BILA|nr:hypothetical protein WR25_09377 [Diploscapter pachys]